MAMMEGSGDGAGGGLYQMREAAGALCGYSGCDAKQQRC